VIDWNFFCSRCDGSLHRRCGLVGGEFDSSLGMTTPLSPDLYRPIPTQPQTEYPERLPTEPNHRGRPDSRVRP
jgi:hypothetical protein